MRGERCEMRGANRGAENIRIKQPQRAVLFLISHISYLIPLIRVTNEE